MKILERLEFKGFTLTHAQSLSNETSRYVCVEIEGLDRSIKMPLTGAEQLCLDHPTHHWSRMRFNQANKLKEAGLAEYISKMRPHQLVLMMHETASGQECQPAYSKIKPHLPSDYSFEKIMIDEGVFLLVGGTSQSLNARYGDLAKWLDAFESTIQAAYPEEEPVFLSDTLRSFLIEQENEPIDYVVERIMGYAGIWDVERLFVLHLINGHPLEELRQHLVQAQY